MSEETTSAYVSQPRGGVRIPGMDVAAVDARLQDCADFFLKHVDETDYRNLDWYLQRSQLRFSVGDDIYDVIDDMFMAARCLHERHAMHLELKPPEMFLTRRILPVELGIISGMPMLMLEFSATYGLPLMMVMGQTAPEDIMGEANLMTSYFRRGFCADFYELAGLAAVIYAGVLAAIGRGFEDEATIGLSTYAKARDSLRGAPPASILPKIKRYDALNTALACLCNGSFHLIGEMLSSVAEDFLADQMGRAGSGYCSPDKMPVPKYYDASILSVLALAALRGEALVLPGSGAIAGYSDFIRGLVEMPERRIEVPGLDEEARQILLQAGVDPDQLQGSHVDNSFQTAKEESEAKARVLFEERQRRAQLAVQAKLAQESLEEEDSHLSIAPRRFVHEVPLKLHEEEGEGADLAAKEDVDRGAGFDFSHEDTQETHTQGKAEDVSVVQAVGGKSYASFFDDLDEGAIPKYDDGSEDRDRGGRGHRTFSQDFFSETSAPTELKMALDVPPAESVGVPDDSTDSVAPVKAEEAGEAGKDEGGRDFSKIFEESTVSGSHGLRMTSVPEEDAGGGGGDARSTAKRALAEAMRAQAEAQIRELEAAQAQRVVADRASREADRLMLMQTEAEEGAEVREQETYQERAARLIAEKQAAMREQALKEREASQRELEALKARGVERPVVEALRLTPDVSTDPDEVVQKVEPDDLCIQGFAYTELDMIHANTAQREELAEDFDMHMALASQEHEVGAVKSAPAGDEAALDEIVTGAVLGAPPEGDGETQA
ncbi:MAG: hypothetical protein FWC40_01450 [Proteobacteria bacterium]|nr:hypothetical protein [Pseudomonadota bacterium]